MPVPRTDHPAIARASLRETTYARLRDAIVEGTLLPGERLRDTELEHWLGVSRTPIREAMLELQRAGLVVSRAGRETLVSPVDAEATHQAGEVASALHELAARLAVPRLSPPDLASLRGANARFRPPWTRTTLTRPSPPTTRSTGCSPTLRAMRCSCNNSSR